MIRPISDFDQKSRTSERLLPLFGKFVHIADHAPDGRREAVAFDRLNEDPIVAQRFGQIGDSSKLSVDRVVVPA